MRALALLMLTSALTRWLIAVTVQATEMTPASVQNSELPKSINFKGCCSSDIYR